jgi:hypothetical protein
MPGYQQVRPMRVVDVLAPYLIGAAAALAVQMLLQFYVTPRVDTRRRRAERFESDVLGLGELLTSELEQRAYQARLEQSLFRLIRQKVESGQVQTARGVDEHASKARQLTWDFIGFARTRIGWLAERIEAFSPEAEEIIKFQIAWMLYLLRAEAIAGWSADEEQPDTEFEAAWQAELDARHKLTERGKALANLPHPPRPQYGGRFGLRRQAARIARSLRSSAPGSA